jgi:hypothetical protein
MDLSAMDLGFPFILIHILNILFYVAIAAVIGIFIVKLAKKQRGKA